MTAPFLQALAETALVDAGDTFTLSVLRDALLEAPPGVATDFLRWLLDLARLGRTLENRAHNILPASRWGQPTRFVRHMDVREPFLDDRAGQEYYVARMERDVMAKVAEILRSGAWHSLRLRHYRLPERPLTFSGHVANTTRLICEAEVQPLELVRESPS